LVTVAPPIWIVSLALAAYRVPLVRRPVAAAPRLAAVALTVLVRLEPPIAGLSTRAR
jgi:hypothetical protein